MKKLLAFMLVLALCLSLCTGLTACVQKETGSSASSTQSGLDAALMYVKTLYKETTEKTSRDFTRIGSVPVNGKTYEVVWSVDVAEEHVKVVKNADGSVTIDVNETSAEEVPYTLTATIKDGDKVVSFSWKHIVPKVNLDFGAIVDEAYALEQGASMDREVTLTGVINKVDTPYDEGYKNITVTMDVIGVEGKPIQCYRLKGEGAENLKPGDTITVSGTLTNYQGKIQFNAGCQLLSVTPAGEVEAPTDVETIMKEAFELADGGSTKYQATLTGKITKINTPYNPSYKNVSVTIAIEGYEGKELLCYRIKGEGADSLLIGDTITVKGYIVNYKGSVQFGEGSALLKVEKTGSEVEAPSDPKQIVKEAYELKEDESLPYKATLTGKITKIDDPYSPFYGNITVTIVVEGMTDKPIKCYHLAGKGVENVDFGIGDTITVTGQITNYKGEVEFAHGCTLDKWENTVKDTIKELTVKEAIDMALSTEHNVYSDKKYKVTGTITEVYDAAYGNMKISDAQGNILTIYGSYSSDGSTAYKDMASKPVAGDVVTIMGPVGNYNGTPQIKNGWILSFETPKMPSYAELGLPAENEAEITIEQALAAGKKIPLGMYTENKYKVTGVITEVKQTTYGNLYIEDAEGNTLYIYGTFNADGSKKYGEMDVKPIVGDTITVLGILGNYKGDAQMKNGNIIDHKVPEIQLEVSFDLNYDDAGEAPASFKVNPNTAYGTLPTPIRDGWKFISWHKDKECTTEAVTHETTVTESHTLFAKWEKVEAIDPDVLAAMQAIVDAAYALTGSETLTEKTLIGQIVEITTAYNESNNKITVILAVEGREDKAIKCYNMTGDNAADVAALAIGDTITVTGTLKVYKGTVQFDPASLVDVVKGTMDVVTGMTDAEIVDAAYAVEKDRYLPGRYTLTGKITSVDKAYDPSFGNVEVTIVVEGKEDKPIKVYRVKGEGAGEIAVGDTITVTGIIKNYNDTVEFDQGCILVSYEKPEPSGEQIEVSFDLNYENAPAAPNAIPVTVGAAYGELPTPEREGYTFGGWYTEDTCTNAVDASTPVTATEDHVLYAKWTENSAIPEETMQDIVDAAYELTGSNTLANKTLTGQIVEITTPYNANSNKITVIIAVEGRESKAIKCYNLTGEAADMATLSIGDTITVTGTLKYYSHEIEFDSGCTLVDVVDGTLDVVTGMTDAEIVDAAYAVEKDRFLPGRYTLTGVITSVSSAYNPSFGNVDVIIAVEGKEDTPIKCFRLKGEGADVIAAGDTITVTGIIKNYNGTVEFDQGCILVSYEKPEPSGEQIEVSFDLNYENAPAAPNAIPVTVGAAYGELPTPEREGYTFGGWYTEDTCTNAVDASTPVTATEDHVLYAKWTENSSSEGGSEEAVPTELTISFASTDIRTVNTTTQQVWVQNGITFTYDKASYNSNLADYSNPIRLYAGTNATIACEGMTQITFVGAGEAKHKTAIATSLTNAGYTPVVDGNNYTVTFAEPVDSLSFSLAAQARVASITVTALVAGGSEGGSGSEGEGGETPDPVMYDVTFDLNGAEGTAPTAIQVEEGKAYGELPPDPTREGYTFGGWFLTKACDGEAVTASTEVTQSHTLYAKWVAIPGQEPEPEPEPENEIVVGQPYIFGMTQGNKDNKVYYLKGGMDSYYLATTLEANDAIRVYVEETEGGYYFYTLDGETKLYINMVVSNGHVNGAYEETASTVYTYDAEHNTLIGVVDGTEYWFATRNDKTFTNMGPCAVSYNGFYGEFYEAAEKEPVTPVVPDHVEPSSVTYTYVSNDDYSNVIANWGYRGDVATSLSPNAKAFYTGTDTYVELAKLSGSSTLSSVPQSTLYTALKNLMVNKHTKQTTYGDTRYLFGFTDCEGTNSDTFSPFYSGGSKANSWDQGKTWNREHCWPKSKTSAANPDNDDAGGDADIMTLRPTLQAVNSGRNNTAYGESSGYYNPNKHTNIYDLRGDVARLVLYTYVRWEETATLTGTNGAIESVDVLLKWIESDPVDSWELARNDSVESITGTRNVFVDYPQLAFLLFGEEVPANLTVPSAS